MNKPKNTLFIIACLLCLGHSLLADNKLINKKSAKTEHLLRWSLDAVKRSKDSESIPKKEYETFRKIIAHLRSLPGDIALNNKSFHADLQKIVTQYNLFLYNYGQQCIKLKRPDREMNIVLSELKNMKAHDQLKLPFFAKLERWPEYYKAKLSVLEMWESRPDRLIFDPVLPPHFVIKESFKSDTLHDILGIYDIAIKNHWKPSANEEKRILVTIANAYNKLKLHRHAITALEMAKDKQLKLSFQTRIQELKKKTTQAVSGDDLY